MPCFRDKSTNVTLKTRRHNVLSFYVSSQTNPILCRFSTFCAVPLIPNGCQHHCQEGLKQYNIWIILLNMIFEYFYRLHHINICVANRSLSVFSIVSIRWMIKMISFKLLERPTIENMSTALSGPQSKPNESVLWLKM